MKKLLLLLCLAASTAHGQLIISPPATAGVGGGGGDALVADPLSQFASTTSAQLATVISDETGSGPLVFATAPDISGGTHIGLTSFGIRSSGAAFDLTLATAEVLTAGHTLSLVMGDADRTITLSGSPTLSGITTTGTGTLALGAKTLTASNTLTLAGTDSTTMTFPSTSATIARTDAANTFTGTQTVGALVATTFNGNTWGTGTGTLSIAAGKTLTASRTLTLTGTDSTTMTFPATSATIARTDAANTFTGHQTIEGVTSTGATGTGQLVFDTAPTLASPVLTTPNLGTPSALTLTSATGLPIAGLVASTSTALGVGSIELGAATDTTIARSGAGAITVEGTAVLLSGGALGTPSSGTLTNATGLPIAGLSASTSTALGVGSIELGAASDTTIARSGAGAITVEGVAVPTISSTNTLTNKAITPRVTSISSNATWSPNADTDDVYEITAQAAAATTISNPSGTPVNGQKLIIRATGTAARALTWSGSQWRASSDLALPTTTTTTKTMYLGFVYNTTGPFWDLVAKLDNF